MVVDNDSVDCSDFTSQAVQAARMVGLCQQGDGMSQANKNRGREAAVCVAALLGCLGLTGCAADYNGQSIPSPYYLSDDIQYFPAGPEFKLTREAAAQKEYRDTQAERLGPRPQPVP